MSISYFYFGGRLPGQQTPPQNSANPPQGSLNLLTDRYNPIFNFPPDFIDNLNSISAIDLAKAVPFISLCSVDAQGNILKNFTTDVFQKSFDPSILSQNQRNADRPEASLEKVEIKSDNASGYLYYTQVSITIKIHRPSTLINQSLMSLLFPGMNFLLEYGWSSQQRVLGKTEKMYFSLKTYNINFDETGQSTLVLDGLAFNDRLNTTFIGDTASINESAGETAETALLKDGLYRTKTRLDSYIQYVQNVIQNPGASRRNDYRLLKNHLEAYQSQEQRVRKTIRKQFKQKFNLVLQPPVKQSAPGFPEGYVTVHDIINTMCTDTFNAFHDSVLPTGTTFRFIYGAFSSNVGKHTSPQSPASVFSNSTIADFKIDLRDFKNEFKNEISSTGAGVLTLHGLIEKLVRDFISNDQYWRKLESTSGTPIRDGIKTPEVICNFSNYTIAGQSFVDITLFDVSKDLPITSNSILSISNGAGTASSQDFMDQVIGNPATLPVIRVGHANSFLKKLNLANNTDPQVKAVMISRMAEMRGNNTRDFIPQDLVVSNDQTNIPLTIPLSGEAILLGHVDWKPFRAFFLSTGLYIVDAVYTIQSVSHVLSRDGFETRISFLYH